MIMHLIRDFSVERVTGIEPALSAWEIDWTAATRGLTCASWCPSVPLVVLGKPPLVARRWPARTRQNLGRWVCLHELLSGHLQVMNEIEGATDCRARRFTELFKAHYSSVLAYAGRRVGPDLAQDVVAETFLAAWRNLDQLPSHPLPWLYRTAHFVIANQQRAAARRCRLDNKARWLRTGDPLTSDHAEEIMADLEFAAALRCLSEPDREILRLAAWEGLTVAEIAAVLGCSAVAAKARLYRARQRLSRKLGDDPHEPREQPVQSIELREAQP